ARKLAAAITLDQRKAVYEKLYTGKTPESALYQPVAGPPPVAADQNPEFLRAKAAVLCTNLHYEYDPLIEEVTKQYGCFWTAADAHRYGELKRVADQKLAQIMPPYKDDNDLPARPPVTKRDHALVEYLAAKDQLDQQTAIGNAHSYPDGSHS